MMSERRFNLARRSSRSQRAASCNRGLLRRCSRASANACWSSSMRRREAQHNRLLFKLNRKFVFHRRHHRIAQGDQFSGGRVSQIHKDEGGGGGVRPLAPAAKPTARPPLPPPPLGPQD